MLKTSERAPGGAKDSRESCDIRVWSGSCEHGEAGSSGEKYLCPLCETVATLDHEVKHDTFSHVSGDYDNLS